jgi:ERCC4-type nuclease
MTVELVIDNRERHLIAALEGACEATIEVLDIGDILFRNGEDIILIIERKTISDLKASICDGRAREQKARLLHSGIPICRIMYLIEGNLDRSLKSKVSGIPLSTLLGSLINTQLRDGIKVYKTASLQESARYVQKLFTKLTKDGDKYFKQEMECMSASKYSATLKKKKKANMTPEVWFISQLSLIPQVTEKVAKQIVAKYPTVSSLVLEYHRTPEHLRSKLLADLTFDLSNGKKRRIGDKISTRICKYFHCK